MCGSLSYTVVDSEDSSPTDGGPSPSPSASGRVNGALGRTIVVGSLLGGFVIAVIGGWMLV